MSHAPLIELDHVSFSYGTPGDNAGDAVPPAAFALSDVTLSVEEGEFVGVIGPSGAGKSTLAAVLSGAIPHHHGGQMFGAARIDGRDTCEATLTDIAQVVGSVLQDIDAQTVASVVEDEMLFGLENFGVPHDRIESRIAETLESVGIADLRHREIATLSGGQKQKAAIAAILALRPRVLVLDEPTAALDPVSSRTVFDLLRDANRRLGITVVVIEQAVSLLCEYCDRVAVMDAGRVVLDGSPREVFGHADELRAIGVDSPRVARVSNSLAAAGLVPEGTPPCLSVDDAVGLVKGIVAVAAGQPFGGERGPACVEPAPDRAEPDPSATASHSAESEEKNAGAARPSAPSAASRPSPHAPASRERAAGAQPIVAFRHVEFSYPAGGAGVSDIDFSIYPGELVGVIGQNGAGKTTVTKLLNGLLKPTSGDVEIAGLHTSETPVSSIARHVATLFQNPDRQLCKNTVLEEVAFGLELAGEPTEAARERAARVIERFGLPAEASPFSLSRGQRQMVALAGVVVGDPQVVILDEPTSGLDYRECMTVMETVGEMAERGCAVVMVCHDMEVVSDFAQRLIVMADGRIAGKGRACDVFADEALMAKASITPPQVIALSGRLAREVSPAFAGLLEVEDVVAAVEAAAHRPQDAPRGGDAKELAHA